MSGDAMRSARSDSPTVMERAVMPAPGAPRRSPRRSRRVPRCVRRQRDAGSRPRRRQLLPRQPRRQRRRRLRQPLPRAAPTACGPTAAADSRSHGCGDRGSDRCPDRVPGAAESFDGIQLHNFTGGYMIPWLDAGTAAWKAATGGDAVANNVDFAQKQIKQAGIIATAGPVLRHDVHDRRVRVHPEVRRAPAAAGHVGRGLVRPDLERLLPELAEAAHRAPTASLRALPLVRLPDACGAGTRRSSPRSARTRRTRRTTTRRCSRSPRSSRRPASSRASSRGWPRRPTCSR